MKSSCSYLQKCSSYKYLLNLIVVKRISSSDNAQALSGYRIGRQTRSVLSLIARQKIVGFNYGWVHQIIILLVWAPHFISAYEAAAAKKGGSNLRTLRY